MDNSMESSLSLDSLVKVGAWTRLMGLHSTEKEGGRHVQRVGVSGSKDGIPRGK
jgi:hypothetical protein